MATTSSPAPPPVGNSRDGKLIEYDEFIAVQIAKTGRQVKFVEIAIAATQLLVLLLCYVLVVVLFDHWLVKGGLGFGGRLAAFVGFFGSALAFIVWRVVPVLTGRVNPVFSAQAIEQTQPTLKNSLINFLLLRRERRLLAAPVYEAIERRAATDLAEASVESAVDHSHLIKVGYVLLALVVFFCAYKVLSPKDPLQTFGRMADPWADLAPPTRVSIGDIQPGTTKVFRGESVKVSALLMGLRKGEPVTLYFSTADGQAVNHPLVMSLPKDSYRHEVTLPADGAGIEQTTEYYIAAGDATSRHYKIVAVTAPAILVDRVEYQYPDYAEVPPRTVERQGDLQGIEGTRVTIEARANVPIQTAYLDFNADGGRDLALAVDGRKAVGRLVLKRSGDRPEFDSYQIRFIDAQGHENPQPIRHSVEVLPDQPPAIEITAPAKDLVEVAANGSLPITLRAADRDFKLRRVSLLLARQGTSTRSEVLLDEPRAGTFHGAFVFQPDKLTDAQLQPGDEVEYWAEARDNRAPEANRTETVHYKIRIAGRVSDEEARRQQSQAQKKAEQSDQDANPQRKEGRAAEQPEPSEKEPEDTAATEPRRSDENPLSKHEQIETSNPQQREHRSQAERSPDPVKDPTEAMERILEHEEEKAEQGGEDDKQQPDRGESGKPDQANDPHLPHEQGGADKQGQKSNSADQRQNQQPAQQQGEQAEDGGKQDQRQSDQQQSQSGGQQQGSAQQQGTEQQLAGQQSGQQQGTGQQQGAGQKSGQQSSSGEEGSGSSATSSASRGGTGKQSDGKQSQGQQSTESNPGDTNRQSQQGGSSAKGDHSQGEQGNNQSAGDQTGDGKRGGSKSGGQKQNRGGQGDQKKQEQGKQPQGKESSQGDGGQQGQSGEQQGTQGENKQGSANAGQGSKGQNQDHNVQAGNAQTQQGKTEENEQKGQASQAQGQSGNQQQGPEDASQSGKGNGHRNDGQQRSGDDAKQGSDEDRGQRPGGLPNRPMNQQAQGQQGQQAGGGKRREQGQQPPQHGNQQRVEPDSAQGQGDKSGEQGALDRQQPSSQQPQQPNASGGDPQNQKGNAGAGQSSQKQNPSPQSQEASQARQKQSSQNPTAADKNQNREEGSSPSNSKKESDSKGGESGDRSGGGKQGGGQKANAPGTGSAGQNTAADQGEGQAEGAGEGDASNQAGNRGAGQPPQQGQGAQSAGQGSPGQSGNGGQTSSSTGSRGGRASNKAPKGGERLGDSDTLSGNRKEPADDSNENAEKLTTVDKLKPSQDRRDGDSRRGQSDTGGPPEHEQDAEDVHGTTPTAADPVNLEFKKKATEFVLDSLKNQIDRNEIDRELLDKLKWTPEDLRKFVDRWEALRKGAKEDPNARLRFEQALEGLNLKRRGVALKQEGGRGDDKTLRETRWTDPPTEYAEQFKAYTEGAARSRH